MFKRSLIFLGLLGTANPAFATWSSGGSELIKHTRNPWFIQNTKQVTFCIFNDEATMGQNTEKVRDFVLKGLSYWKEELRESRSKFVEVATQQFTEISCSTLESSSREADVVFQFGVLTEQQKKVVFNDRPQGFVGVAVRTDYDLLQMRGKGFIYVAPQTGPLKPDISMFDKNVWSSKSGSNLKRVIAHELGHVFGLGHFGEGMMAVDFAEKTVTSNPYGQGDDGIEASIPRIFTYSNKLTLGGSCLRKGYEKLKQEWGIDPNYNCIDFIKVSDLVYDVVAYCVLTSDTNCEKQGKPTVARITLNKLGASQQLISTLYLPDAQRVYPLTDFKYYPLTYLPSYRLGGSILVHGTKSIKPILLELQPEAGDWSSLSVTIGNEMIPNYFYVLTLF